MSCSPRTHAPRAPSCCASRPTATASASPAAAPKACSRCDGVCGLGSSLGVRTRSGRGTCVQVPRCTLHTLKVNTKLEARSGLGRSGAGGKRSLTRRPRRPQAGQAGGLPLPAASAGGAARVAEGVAGGAARHLHGAADAAGRHGGGGADAREGADARPVRHEPPCRRAMNNNDK